MQRRSGCWEHTHLVRPQLCLLLLQVGGHAMPVAGKIGGAKGIGLADDPKVRARKLPPDTLTAETWASHGHG
jgi:hypothetical protein